MSGAYQLPQRNTNAKYRISNARTLSRPSSGLPRIDWRSRGAVPSAMRRALTAWPDALGAEWPANSKLGIAALSSERDEDPRRPPPIGLASARKLDLLWAMKYATQGALSRPRFLSRLTQSYSLRTCNISGNSNEAKTQTRRVNHVKNEEATRTQLAAGFPAHGHGRGVRLGPSVDGQPNCVSQGKRSRRALPLPAP